MGFSDSILLFIVLSITLLFQSPLLHLPVVAAKDTLMPGDELSHLSTLVSSNAIVTFGFYTISPSAGTNLTYLGIWLTNDNVYGEKLWIANRDQSITSIDAILTMDASSGTLRVKNRSGATLFDVSNDKVGLVGNKNNTRAMLEDSGNLIVYDVVTNHTIWESFDHPTDTLIPGMKLGYNLTAKQNWELTSSVSDMNPSSDIFTMRLKQYQKSPQLLIYRRDELYWASGPWNKTTGTFHWLDTSMNLVEGSSLFDLKYDPSGTYLIVQMIGSRPSRSTLMHLPRYDFCPGHGYWNVDGCVVSASSYCRAALLTSTSSTDVYHWEYSYNSDFDDYHKIDDNSSIRIDDCKKRCWNDCDCKACSSYNDSGTGCIYYGTYNFSGFKDVRLSKKYILVSDKSLEFKYPKESRWTLLCLATVPILVLAFVTIRIRIRKGKENRRRDEIIIQLISSNSFNYGDELERGIQNSPDVNIFSLKAILAATNNFSSENKLGHGGYDPVYKLKGCQSHQDKEF